MNPATGYPIVDAVLQILGGLYVICSVLGHMLPRDRGGAFFARLALDLRSDHAEPPST